MNIQGWSYEEAFSRHKGIFTAEEQEKLKKSCVAVAGLGGVGGIELVTLARLGIGRFHIADRDKFEVANFNRQYGAKIETIGKSKVEVMEREIKQINPEAEVRIFPEGLTKENASNFLEGVNVYVDGLDYFALTMRRLVFQEARKRGVWAVTAGPHMFSTAWLIFSPDGMSFDEYFDLHDGMDPNEQLAAFAVGLVPQALHLKYINLAASSSAARRAVASLGLACQMAAGVAAAETVKILLKKGEVRAAPWYSQFDAYLGKCVQRRLAGGNRHPIQRIKRWWLLNQMRKK